ncbi:helix-turn-helix domain-containing protein [Runella sp.]|uniref:helix-turn-helix domain-containing protein n=1 Tax=Runella sp. TaxID=1960881 RepID=UPI003D0EB8F1
MIYSLQLSLVFLGLVITVMCIRANQGVHLRYLGAFFMIITATELLQLKTAGLQQSASFLLVFPETLALLIPPAVVCYLRSSLGFKDHIYSKWLLIPAFLYLKTFSYLYVGGVISGNNFTNSTFYACVSAEVGIYNAFVGLFLFHFLSKAYANLTRSIHPITAVWLKSIVGFLLFHSLMVTSKTGIRFFYGEDSSQYVAYEWFWLTGLVVWSLGIIFLMVKYPFVLKTFVPNVQVSYWVEEEQEIVHESRENFEVIVETEDHYEQISSKKDMPIDLRIKYVEKIRYELEVREVFLDSKLTLSSLAKKVGISSHQLSYIINSEWKMNFNEFVNSYRITKARNLLKDIHFQTATIFAIGIDSGFNSESSFYTAFKKATGYSPKRYRETLKLTSEL